MVVKKDVQRKKENAKMNKKISNSVKKKLYKKTAEKIEEMRQAISASIFENYPGAHEDYERLERSGGRDIELDADDEAKKEEALCFKKMKEKNPNLSDAEIKEKCKKVNEGFEKDPVAAHRARMDAAHAAADKRNKDKKSKPKPQPKAAPELAVINDKGKKSAFDIMARALLGLGEEKIPAPVVARRIAGGMDPKTAKTKKLGFKGKHPGKG